MILNLTKLSDEEIKEDTKRAANELSTQIMYLHNNGKNNYKWKKKDFLKVLEDDIEE